MRMAVTIYANFDGVERLIDDPGGVTVNVRDEVKLSMDDLRYVMSDARPLLERIGNTGARFTMRRSDF